VGGLYNLRLIKAIVKIMKFYYHRRDIELDVPEDVYYPEEDSLFLAETLEKMDLNNKNCLDMGTGSGFLAILMYKKGAIVTASDINLQTLYVAMKNSQANTANINGIQSDLFRNIKGRFDLIVFNPPYLPKDKHDSKEDTTGGERGFETIEDFAKGLRKHLNPGGKALLLFSSITNEENVREIFRKRKFGFQIAARKKLPWEELAIAEITLNLC
jgi:release factor glutamine methyltransferase